MCKHRVFDSSFISVAVSAVPELKNKNVKCSSYPSIRNKLTVVFFYFSFFVVFVFNISLGPVVQSIVSLTSSLRVISLTVLADSIHNILVFFAEKM